MKTPEFGFYFELAGRQGAQGAIAPAEQFFEGSGAECSLARETGQNSIDARAGAGPVIMNFELRSMKTDSIPGIDELRTHLECVEHQTRGTQGHPRMLEALQTSLASSIEVLRISDFGTVGLKGAESVNNLSSPLSALTRGDGISADDGVRGGSFGIGSAVGPMASSMCTVLYTSLTEGSNQVVFAGHARLASHRDKEDLWRSGSGYYTKLEATDFEYLRNPGAIGPFDQREQPGTDVFILGYRMASGDPGLTHIRDAFVNNFMLAIHRGELVINGASDKSTWRIDQSTLKQHALEVPDAEAFLRAVEDPDPIQGESQRFGQLKLYINVDDSLDKTLHTVTVRTPLMKIETYRHNSIPAKYAAILECSDDKGNKLLRRLEPPQHDRWDPGRADGGRAAVDELKTFIRNGLRKRVVHQIGTQVEIKGLAKYLPNQSFSDELDPSTKSRVPKAGPGTKTESATRQGAPAEDETKLNPKKRSVKVQVQTSATAEGKEKVDTGKKRGGTKPRASDGTGLDGKGTKGDGKSRIKTGEVRFRSWSGADSKRVRIAINSESAITGDLELVALGAGGTVEDSYVLPIAKVNLLDEAAPRALDFEGNVIRNLAVTAGKPVHLELELSASHRFRLGVK